MAAIVIPRNTSNETIRPGLTDSPLSAGRSVVPSAVAYSVTPTSVAAPVVCATAISCVPSVSTASNAIDGGWAEIMAGVESLIAAGIEGSIAAGVEGSMAIVSGAEGQLSPALYHFPVSLRRQPTQSRGDFSQQTSKITTLDAEKPNFAALFGGFSD